MVQAAERPGSANERMIDVTKWIDRRGRMHKAAEWTDVNGKLLHELMAANGLECQTMGQSQVGGTMLFQMGHAWRVYMDLADKMNQISVERFANAHGGPAAEVPEQPDDHRAFLARVSLEEPEAYANATAVPRTTVVINAPEVELQCAACLKKAADEGVRLRRCGGCSNIYYCSPECSRADWPRHKAQCKAVQKAVQKAA